MDVETMKRRLWSIHCILLALVTLGFGSCKDESSSQAEPYDANKPVAITDFTPKTGGGNSRLVIYGENFGTDLSLIKVTIGGIEAKVINVLSTSIYCLTPPKCYKGDVKLTIGKAGSEQVVTASQKFIYERQMVVSNLCGYRDEKGNYDIKDGPFTDCGGFANPTWLSFDPKDHRYLYLAQDEGKPMRMFDLKEERVYTVLPDGSNGMNRMRTITWTTDGDTMIIANDQGAEERVCNSFLKRKGIGKEAFTEAQTLNVGKQCNGSAVHPINHELYYNSFGMGEVFKLDYWKNGILGKSDKLYNIQDRDWEFNFQIHPSGNYAYIVVVNQHYIMRTDYNWNKRTFGTPYLVCGAVGQRDWVDKVGENARLSNPYQGVFVKNKQYVGEGSEDVYDFYFCDRGNQCVRILTPDGSVTTFAGRGSVGVNLDAHGYINGSLRKEARFDNPAAIAYDEATETFYIGDISNRRIRKIALEAGDEDAADANN